LAQHSRPLRNQLNTQDPRVQAEPPLAIAGCCSLAFVTIVIALLLPRRDHTQYRYVVATCYKSLRLESYTYSECGCSGASEGAKQGVVGKASVPCPKRTGPPSPPPTRSIQSRTRCHMKMTLKHKKENIAFSLYLLLKIFHNTVYEIDHAHSSSCLVEAIEWTHLMKMNVPRCTVETPIVIHAPLRTQLFRLALDRCRFKR